MAVRKGIQLKLVKLKVFYFLYYGGVGALLPFIPVYLKQSGLTASENGIIFGFLPFVSSVTRPFLGGLVDKYNVHKPVFIMCCLLSGVIQTSLMLVPKKDNVQSQGNTSWTSLWDKGKLLPVCRLPIAYLDLSPDVDLSNLEWLFSSNYSHTESNPVLNRVLYCKITKPRSTSNLTDSVLPRVFAFQLLDVLNSVQLLNGTRCVMKVQNITVFALQSPITCHNSSNYSCYSWPSSNISAIEDRPGSVGEFMAPFWLSFLILNVARLFHTTVMSFTDAVAFSYLEEDRSRYGIQRLFGSIGFVTVSVPVSVLLHLYAKRAETTDFSMAFFVHLAFSCAAAFSGVFMKISFHQKASNLCATFCKLLKDKHIGVMLLVATFAGAQLGIIEGFGFWYLKQIGASQLILGLCVGIGLISEILFFFVSAPIVRRFGEIPALQMSLLGAAVRSITLSFVTNPWFSLPIQLFQGPTFSLMWAASTAYVSSVAPRGMALTAQTILGSLLYGVGYGTGSLVTGIVYEAIGAAWTFRMNGALTVVVLVLFALGQGCCLKPKKQQNIDICEIAETVTGSLLTTSADNPPKETSV